MYVYIYIPVYNIHCTLYSVQCTLEYILPRYTYSIDKIFYYLSAVYSVHYTVYTIHGCVWWVSLLVCVSGSVYMWEVCGITNVWRFVSLCVYAVCVYTSVRCMHVGRAVHVVHTSHIYTLPQYAHRTRSRIHAPTYAHTAHTHSHTYTLRCSYYWPRDSNGQHLGYIGVEATSGPARGSWIHPRWAMDVPWIHGHPLTPAKLIAFTTHTLLTPLPWANMIYTINANAFPL